MKSKWTWTYRTSTGFLYAVRDGKLYQFNSDADGRGLANVAQYASDDAAIAHAYCYITY
jgi:hypothetical protein